MRLDASVGCRENSDLRPLAELSASVAVGGETVDVSGLAWRKSSASTTNGDCVEVACFPAGGVAVRDSKDKAGGILRFGRDSWQQFLDQVRHGSFPAP